jgi:hypothetical protein
MVGPANIRKKNIIPKTNQELCRHTNNSIRDIQREKICLDVEPSLRGIGNYAYR